MGDTSEILSLYNLARACGVETEYYDVSRRKQVASPEALLAVLKALGMELERVNDVPAARRAWRQRFWRQILEPVVVAWDGWVIEIEIRLPSERSVGMATCHLQMESGERRSWNINLSDLPIKQQLGLEGQHYTARKFTIPEVLPMGYHRMILETRGGAAECMIISSPLKAYSFQGVKDGIWGVFVPLYALYSRRSWGSGDFSDLEALVRWVSGLGGGAVATLPLLASFLDVPCDPSPYMPVSRLFWNEFYLDITSIPEMGRCPEAQAMLESGDFRAELDNIRSMQLVDYRRQMALKRRVLEKLAACFFLEPGDRLHAFREFVKEHERVEDYSRFRATCELKGKPWPAWPERLRKGLLKEGDYDKDAQCYHAYVQWLADEQLRRLSDEARHKGVSLYLDLPLGVHPHGYDIWRERDIFVADVSAGAPPDILFSKGQVWGFPPLHPQKIREKEYRYLIAYLRHHMRYAEILRLDHVMGIHRLFWIPAGMEATDGVYVRYPADELYAVLSVESRRHRCLVVGENLGTVPSYINDVLSRHGIYGMYVAQYEMGQSSDRALRAVPIDVVAGINTHDMPPFSAFWQGLDIERRRTMGLLNNAEAKAEIERRHMMKRTLVEFLRGGGYLKGDSEDPGVVLWAYLSFLAASPARILLVNLEDLWLETEPQNVPGMVDEYPNWRRKARYELERFTRMPQVLDLLRSIRRPRCDKGTVGNRG